MATTKEAPTKICEDITPEYREIILAFFNGVGVGKTIKPEHNVKDSFSNLVGGVLKVVSVERGKLSCLLCVKPAILNAYGGMHGGAVGAVAERVAIACARTVVGEDKDIFLGELSISYLYAAPHNEIHLHVATPWFFYLRHVISNASTFRKKRVVSEKSAEVVVDGSVVRSGRNLTVVAVNFRLKESGRLAFMARATFYNTPVSSL